MLNKSIIDKVSKVPPLPDSVIKAEALFSQSNPSMSKLVKIVEEDPVLTADILALANSSFYSFSTNILSVQQALTLFGMKSIRGFILSSISKQSFQLDMSPYGIDNQEYKDLSMLQSTLMFQWFMTIDIEQSGVLVPIAFLMDIGKIIIAQEVIHNGDNEKFLEMLNGSDSISEVEKHFTGMTSAEVTALLFRHWNFNETFINVKGCMSEENFKAAKMKALGYGLSIANFIKTVERIQDKIFKE